MTFELVNRTRLSDEELSELARAVQRHETLEDIFRWARAENVHDGSEDLVVQDEFTYDAIFPFRARLFLVYAVT